MKDKKQAEFTYHRDKFLVAHPENIIAVNHESCDSTAFSLWTLTDFDTLDDDRLGKMHEFELI